MRCHRNVRRGAIAMSDGGGNRNIRIIDADSSFGGARRGGPDSELGGHWPPRAPPLEPPLVICLEFLVDRGS